MPVQTVSFLDPYAAEQQEIQRRRLLAERLRQEAALPLEMPQAAPGGIVPRISPLQGLAKMLQAYGARKGMEATDAEEKALQQRRDEEYRRDLARALQAGAPRQEIPQPPAELGGGPGAPADYGAFGVLAESRLPELQRMGLQNIMAQMGPQKPMVVGRSAIDPRTGRVVATDPTVAAEREAKAKEKEDERIAREEFLRQQQEREQAFRNEQARQAAAERENLTRVAAGLRPAPPPEPLVSVEDPSSPTGVRYATRAEAHGMPAPRQERNLTEGQGKAALYGSRAALADKALKELEDNISVVGLASKQFVQRTPLVGGILGAAGNVMLSADQQRVEQAQRDFVNAILRQESGAVISDAEFLNAQRQYFPQPGDTPQVIEQKRKNRQTAIQGFRRMAGPAAPDIDMALQPVKPSAQEAGGRIAQPRRRATDTPQSVLDAADAIIRGGR